MHWHFSKEMKEQLFLEKTETISKRKQQVYTENYLLNKLN